MNVEIESWRLLCRGLGLREAVEQLAPLLATHLGTQGVILRRLDHESRRVETVAAAGLPPSGSMRGSRNVLSAADFFAAASWAEHGEILCTDAAEHGDLLALLVPSGLDAPLLAGPLAGSERPLGAVLFVGRGQRPEEDRAERIRRLLDPFAAALENDERIRELTRLREALEADRSALLTRLQREDISEAVVGAETGLAEVMLRVRQVAPTDAPVLINGETGSGKEVIARAIHERSPRARGPMLKVNCGAIPPGLVDSELFGHERGSFTGAQEQRRGWFERADGGTLFLDEVAELAPAAQVRLLRVLQDGTLVRVGGQKAIRVDVRVVAATHRQLDEMVRQGTMREDLFYRIAVFPIRLPPLRERRQDIPALAAHFAWRAGKRLGGRPLNPSPEDVQRLLDYRWPGNVRELAAVIERAAILGECRRLEIAAALGGFGSGPPAAGRPEDGGATGDEDVVSLDRAMVLHMERALRATSGRIEGPDGAAALLGINPHTLRSRMRKQGLDWARFRLGGGRGSTKEEE